MKKLLTLALSILSAGVVFADASYPDISLGDLKKAIADKKVTLIDVNGSDRYKKGHIPSAVHFEASAEKLGSVLPADKNALVVAYCGGPACNAYKDGADAAKKLGYTNVKHFTAGISGWEKAGEKTEPAK